MRKEPSPTSTLVTAFAFARLRNHGCRPGVVNCAGVNNPPVVVHQHAEGPAWIFRSGFFIDLDQSAHTGPAHRPAMAGIDWTQVIGITTLVLSAAVICIVVFAL
jgi:hypothetical protein